MGKTVRYLVLGAFAGCATGFFAVLIIGVLFRIDGQHIGNFFELLKLTTVIGMYFGLKWAGDIPDNITLTNIIPLLRQSKLFALGVFVLLIIVVIELFIPNKPSPNAYLFYMVLMAAAPLMYLINIRNITLYTNASSTPRVLLFFGLLFFGYMMVQHSELVGGDKNEMLVKSVVFAPAIIITVTWFLSIQSIAQLAADIKRTKQEDEILDAYGSKGWATSEQVTTALKGASDGVYIGGGFFFNQQGNILTVGGPRGGKGVNLILPALLDESLSRPNAQSWIILDPKGENCAVAAPYLKNSGYKVLVINPFGIPEIDQFGNAQFNVFDLFNIYSRQFASFVDMVITSLMPETQKEDDFFTPAGREVLRFYIGYMMVQDEEPKTFMTLYNWLHLAGKQRDELLIKMTGCTGLNGVVRAGAMGIVGMLDDDAGKTVGGIYAAAKLAISVFGDTDLRYSVERSDFTLDSISKEKTAIFICANPRELTRVKAWVRILFNSFIDNMLQGYNTQRKVVVPMDEFHKLGALKVIRDNVSFLPGYNVIFWPIVQSLGQLKDLYPDIWEDFIASSTVRQYLSIQDSFTAEYLSKRMPQIIKFVGSNADGSPKEIRIPLLSMDEIIAFPNILVEMNGLDRPAQFVKKPYWGLNDNGQPNPFR